ncbi:hypothetical protein JML65_00160 [Chryseobacterium sp. KMC2]|nr:hypothetical protein [Chryseobacterium sp. KMC2]
MMLIFSRSLSISVLYNKQNICDRCIENRSPYNTDEATGLISLVMTLA